MHTYRAMLLALILVAPAASQAQEAVGTSTSDLPSYLAEFSITNHTGTPIVLQWKWGDNNWKPVNLTNGNVETFKHPLPAKDARIATPVVRYLRLGGDGKYAWQEVRMGFAAVGGGGFGPDRSNYNPKPYDFKVAGDGRTIDLIARY